jgi:hypothetical protein
MIRLGATVWFRGRRARVVARTLAGNPTYDIRCPDGTVVKYVDGSEIVVVDTDEEAA